MDLKNFFEDNTVPEVGPDIGEQENIDSVSLDCAIQSRGKGSIHIEYQGTSYEVTVEDILDVTLPSSGVVTASGVGTPARLTVKSNAKLRSVRRILARDMIGSRPFVLDRPSAVPNITFDNARTTHERAWLQARGIRAGASASEATMSTLYSDSTCPTTSHPRMDNWVSDDSQPDGQHPDD